MKFSILWLAVLVAACTTTPNLDIANPTGSLPQLDSVIFIDKNLQQTQITRLFGITLKNKVTYQISVVNIGSSMGETGYMQAWALFQNHTDLPLHLEARVVFMDDNRVIGTNGSSTWQPLYLTANGIEKFEGLAGFANASHFIIEVR